MPATRVKICGLTREPDVETAVHAGADAVGFVVDVPVDTPRELTPAPAASLASTVPPFVTTVLVTMADTPDRVAALCDLVGADAVQVHGDLVTQELGAVTARVDVPVIAATNPTTDDIETIAAHADAVLLDSTDDTGAGGTGTVHDWEYAATIVDTLTTPVVLAGGLTPDNVATAVETTTPYAVDVASGVEATGGTKEPSAVQAFIDAATTTGDPP